MKVYLVGGAVRDQLLGLPVRERDWVVVGATERDLTDRGYRRLDRIFPVFLHPDTGEEYALARRERKIGPGYKGFAVEAGRDVTLEQDLARRDLTVNAIARGEDDSLVDPFGGREDLDAGLLRHVTPAFSEDPVRLLRAARFAAVLGRLGFRIAHGTFGLLRAMAARDELLTVWPDRLREELYRALAAEQPWRFFETLARCGALQVLLPALATDEAASGGHGGARGTGPWEALRQAAAAVPEPAVRLAAALAHAFPDAAAARAWAGSLRLDGASTQLLERVAQWPPARVAGAGPELLLALLERNRALHDDADLERLAVLWTAVDPALGPRAAQRARRALALAKGVRAAALAATGLSGPALGRALREARLAALARVP